MKYQKIIFILTILGILLLLFISTLVSPKIGTIKSISYSENKITILLENSDDKLIIFSNKILDLQEGDNISYLGKEEIYRREKQIIVDKIEKLFSLE